MNESFLPQTNMDRWMDVADFPNANVNISACALGKRKNAYGYSWKYLEAPEGMYNTKTE